MKALKIISLILIVSIFTACISKMETEGPSHVELKHIDGKYRLFVNGEEFYIKGAGCEFGPCHLVAEYGGNSFRTWRTDNGQRSGRKVLDEARENGLMVMMGLDVARERHGFDYDDENAVAEQLESFRQEVLELKDHPALLGWGIGNELNLRYTNYKVWDAVNDIAKMIKEVDGNHVTTTMLAGIGPSEVNYISKNCPDIDFLSIQMYGEIVHLHRILAESGYNGPYIVTEWGATGHWEMPATSWGAPIEQTSTEKATAIKERYKNVILADDSNCLGSYVFLWGHKQERTPSWYGLFTEKGEKTEAVSVLQYLWTGVNPGWEAPEFNDIVIEGKGGRFDNVRLTAGETYKAVLSANHGDLLSIKARAEIMPEPTELSDGGDFEKRPASIPNLVISETPFEVSFKTPEKSGAYRLLVYLVHKDYYAGTANIPFWVE
ncbi:MAG: hypothetical protein KGZ97_11515 [Bacteroidetes bacterium]|nr:hypothetical protein [Bacteroidota bacterium]